MGITRLGAQSSQYLAAFVEIVAPSEHLLVASYLALAQSEHLFVDVCLDSYLALAVVVVAQVVVAVP